MRRTMIPTAVVAAALTAAGLAPAVAQPQQDLTLQASRSKVVYGRAVVLSGGVTSDDATCREGAPVAIEVDARDDMADDWTVVGHTHTRDDGSFEEVVLPENSGTYRATIGDEQGRCGPETSEPVSVDVRVKVELDAATRSVPAGEKARLRVRVQPLCRREATAPMRVRLYRFRNGRFVKVASETVSPGCTASFQRRVNRVAVFQARFPRIDGLHWSYLAGRSPLEVVGVER